VLKKIYIALICFVFLSCNTNSGRYFTSIENGGIKNVPERFISIRNISKEISEGTTVAYWRDAILNIEYPPVSSNKVSTEIRKDFIHEIVFFNYEELGSFENIKYDFKTQKISSLSRYFGQISEIRNLGLEQIITLSDLINLFLQVSTYEDMRLFEFLQELLSLGVISDIEKRLIINFLIEKGLYENILIKDLVEILKEFNYSITVILSELMQFAQFHNLDIELDFSQLEILLINSGYIKDFVIGQPQISLLKSVDKKVAYYGNEINYQISFMNIGQLAAVDVVIIDSLPDNVTFKSSKITGLKGRLKKRKVNDTTILFWQIKKIQPDEKGIISIKVHIN